MNRLTNHLKFLFRYYANFILGFDSIVELTGSRDDFGTYLISSNARFRFAAGLAVAMVLETLYRILQTGSVYDHFLHNISRIWPAGSEQRNVISLGAYLIYPLVFTLLLNEKWTHLDTIVYFRSEDARVVHRGRYLPRSLCRDLIGYFRRMKHRIDRLNIFILLDIHTVWTLPFYAGEFLLPVGDLWSIRNVVYMIITPIYITNIIFVVIYPNYFIINAKYIQIRQRYYIRWFTSGHSLKRFEGKFQELFQFLRDIRVQDRFWSKFITSIIILYSFEVVYIVFMMAETKTPRDRLQLLPIIAFASFYLLSLYIFSTNSSRIYANNRSIYRRMRELLMRANFRESRLSLARKLERQCSFEHYFRGTGFRLLDGSKIDNRLFEIAFGTMAVYSLKLFGRSVLAYYLTP